MYSEELGAVKGAGRKVPLSLMMMMSDKLVTCESCKIRETHKNEFAVFPNTAKAVCPPITAQFVKSDGRYEGGVSLTSCDNTLLPGGENCKEVILAASLAEGS